MRLRLAAKMEAPESDSDSDSDSENLDDCEMLSICEKRLGDESFCEAIGVGDIGEHNRKCKLKRKLDISVQDGGPISTHLKPVSPSEGCRIPISEPDEHVIVECENQLKVVRTLLDRCMEDVVAPQIHVMVDNIVSACHHTAGLKLAKLSRVDEDLCKTKATADVFTIETVEEIFLEFYQHHRLEKISSLQWNKTTCDESLIGKKPASVVQIPCSICRAKTQWYCKGCTHDDVRTIAICGYNSERKCFDSHIKSKIRGHLKFKAMPNNSKDLSASGPMEVTSTKCINDDQPES